MLSDDLPPNLADAFAAQARRHPGRLAVSARDGLLTYRDLDERSSDAAQAISDAGAARGSVVALLTGRTTALIVGILGILKAGGAYLPIDPAHPGERTADLVRMAGCQAVVTSAEPACDPRRRPDSSCLTRVVLASPGGGGRPVHSPPRPSAFPRDAASLAYVLPTSGSTGTPKGVQIEDRNVISLVKALDEAIASPLGQPLRIALVAPQVFDASVQQIFLALLLGHSLFIVPEAARADGTLLRRFWAREQVDVSDGTPAHLVMTANAAGEPRIRVRQLLIGGDWLTPGVVRRFLEEAAPGVAITNLYGVAECCVDSVAGRADPGERCDSVPIGQPLPGTIVELLDEELRPAVTGEVGQIYLGGAQVGRGYLGLGDLTARRFVTLPGRRGTFYRTGDLARRLADDRLVFAGRADRQFKLRGHRIEPAEIESALRRYAGPAATANVMGKAAEMCRTCLLTSAYPGVTVTAGVCGVCQAYAAYREDVAAYFGDPAELFRLIRAHNDGRDSRYDVLLLFSGGKDSTYALYRLLDAQMRVLAFTFDNGYLSGAAFDNIRRITSEAGVDLEVGSVPAMDAVFRQSLRAESSVCGGCFRGLTAMSTRLAGERGAHVVVTGLSRGQIFDTKLRVLFEAGIRDPAEIDRRLRVHRELYHARRDRTGDLLELPVTRKDLDDILFVDYFRYDDVTTSQIKRFLIGKDKRWEQPADTGLCSTNCRINEVGIYVHSIERGFHNYAFPLSWDCRLGVLDRAEGLRQLAALAPPSRVTGMLRKLGYTPCPRKSAITDAIVALGPPGAAQPKICAYYAAEGEIDEADLREHLAMALPGYMRPSYLVRMGRLPVTETGKVDLAALPDPRDSGSAEASELPRGPVETRVAAIWQEALAVRKIGRNQDFFEAGGDSLTATVIAGLLQAEFGTSLAVAELFSHPTIAHAAALLGDIGADGSVLPRGAAADPAAQGAPEPVLLKPGPGPGSVFLLPDVWGSIENYRSLVARITGPVWGMSAGLTASLEDQRTGDIDADCRGHAERIMERADHGGLCLVGWSYGGILCLGAAHHISALGGDVRHLVVVDTLPPDRGYWSRQARLCREFLAAGEVPPGDVPFEVHRLVTPGTPADLRTLRGYARAILPVLDALAIFEPPAIPASAMLTYVRAERSGLAAEHAERWRLLSASRFASAVLPGDHFSILSPAGAAALAGYVRPRLGRPARGSP